MSLHDIEYNLLIHLKMIFYHRIPFVTVAFSIGRVSSCSNLSIVPTQSLPSFFESHLIREHFSKNYWEVDMSRVSLIFNQFCRHTPHLILTIDHLKQSRNFMETDFQIYIQAISFSVDSYSKPQYFLETLHLAC